MSPNDPAALLRPIHASRLPGPAFANLAASLLTTGCSLRFAAHGQSMHPFIRDGDIVTVRPVALASLRRGDVILYRTSAGAAVLHRVLSRPRDTSRAPFRTRGDALPDHDESVPQASILGEVCRIERGGRAVRVRHPWAPCLARVIRRWRNARTRLIRATHPPSTQSTRPA